MMIERKGNIQQPEKYEQQKSEQKMRNIWDINIPLSQKQLTDKLNKCKIYFNYLSQLLNVQIEEPNEKAEVNKKEKSPQNKEEKEGEIKLFKTPSKPSQVKVEVKMKKLLISYQQMHVKMDKLCFSFERYILIKLNGIIEGK